MSNLPPALESLDEIFNRIGSKTLGIFLDYDGTLTPIVDRPELAVLSPKMKAVIENLSKQCLVAIISGRGRQDVETLVSIPKLHYAGSHGFDIKGPELEMVPQEVLPILPLIDKTYSELVDKTKEISGSLIENKKFALAIHFRLVDGNEVPKIEEVLPEDCKLADIPDLPLPLCDDLF